MDHRAPFALCGLLVLLTACSSGDTAQKNYDRISLESTIIPQSGWGGTPFAGEARTHRIRFITLHHGGVLYDGAQPAPENLRNLQNWSRSEKKWIDIPYHYMVDLEGKIYEARDIDYPGDTNTNYDPAGHALICVMGNYEEQVPNRQQLDAVASLMAFLVARYDVPLSRIGGHLDHAKGTVCPGKNLYAYLANGWFNQRVMQNLAIIVRKP